MTDQVQSAAYELADTLKAIKGLVDVKLFLRNHEDVTVEQVCSEVNLMVRAWQGGKGTPRRFNDFSGRLSAA
ncbi:MAG TPA: hypothetical protein VG943_12865 [Caulobacterales bacterium]|nr:hypothetical protein [Caulobacterales bacterium]